MVNSFQLEIPVLERFLMLSRRLCGLRNRNTNRRTTTTEHMEKGSKTKMLSALQRCRHFACASNAFFFAAFAEMQTTKQRLHKHNKRWPCLHWIKYLNGQEGFT
jgi:hypothetical protein